jgi:hypothetical protein
LEEIIVLVLVTELGISLSNELYERDRPCDSRLEARRRKKINISDRLK